MTNEKNRLAQDIYVFPIKTATLI